MSAPYRAFFTRARRSDPRIAADIHADGPVAAYKAARTLQGSGGRVALQALHGRHPAPLWVAGMGRVDPSSSRFVRALGLEILGRWDAVEFLLAHPDGDVCVMPGMAYLRGDPNQAPHQWDAATIVGVFMLLVDCGWLVPGEPDYHAGHFRYVQNARPSGHQRLAWARERALEAATSRAA